MIRYSLGFSVLNGLIGRFNTGNFAIRALGGNHFEVLPYLIESLLVETKPDLVILDLVSTTRSVRWTPQSFGDAARYLVNRCQLHGADVAFANLYRVEVNQTTDFLHTTSQAIASEIGASVLDMLELHRAQGHDLEELYPDGNHASPLGYAILGDALEALAYSKRGPQIHCAIPPDYAMNKPTCVRFEATPRFTKHGFDLPILPLPAGETVEVALPPDFCVRGALLGSGPIDLLEVASSA